MAVRPVTKTGVPTGTGTNDSRACASETGARNLLATRWGNSGTAQVSMRLAENRLLPARQRCHDLGTADFGVSNRDRAADPLDRALCDREPQARYAPAADGIVFPKAFERKFERAGAR
jgi:hypothetical protein